MISDRVDFCEKFVFYKFIMHYSLESNALILIYPIPFTVIEYNHQILCWYNKS